MDAATIPPATRRSSIGSAAWVAIAVLVFFSPAIAGPGQFLYRDAGRYDHPTKRWIAAELRAGRVPEWNPYQGLGTPVVSGAIDSVQHPLNLLFLALPFELAFSLWVVSCLLVGGVGALAWARTLGCSPAAGVVAGLAFALSGFLVSSTDNLVHLATMSGAPWLLAAASAYARGGGAGRLLALASASFLCASGGEVLDWGIAALLAGGQALLPAAGLSPRRRAGRALLATAFSAAAAAPILLPFFAGLAGSSRAVAIDLAEAGTWNLHPIRLAELAFPHLVRGEFGRIQNPVYRALTGDRAPTPWCTSLYLGASVAALAALGAAASRRGRLLAAVALALAWMAMGRHAGFGAIASRLPLLSAVRYFERLSGWPTLLLAAAAALGVERLLRDPPVARRLAIGAGAAGAIFLAVGVAARAGTATAWVDAGPAIAERLGANLADGGLHAGAVLVGLALLAVLTARGAITAALPAALALLVALDLAGANARAYLLSSPSLVEAADAPIPRALAAQGHLARLTAPFALDRDRWPEMLPYESGWRWGARTGAPAFHTAWRGASFDTYGGVAPGRLHAFVRGMGPARYVRPSGLLGVVGVSVPHSVSRAAELGLPPPWSVIATDPELPAFLVAIPHRPRAYLAGRLFQADAPGALAFLAGADPATEDRSVVEAPVPAGYVPPATGQVRVTGDAPTRLTLEVTTGSPSLVVVNDTFLEGWTAAVDGREAPILAANYAARGVWVDAGRHTLAFRYRTPWWRAGWALALAAVGALALARFGRRLSTAGSPRAS